MCLSIENKNTAFTARQIKNGKLLKYSNEIQTVVANGRTARIQLCGILAEMTRQPEIFGSLGFDGYCEKFLGIKTSQAYAMVKVADEFEIVREDGWKPRLTARGGAWTQTQLMALLPMGSKNENTRENCEALIARGMLKPSMTVQEIKELVKGERPDAAEKAAKEEKKAKEKKHIEEQKQKVAEKIKGVLKVTLEFYEDSNHQYTLVVDGLPMTDFGDSQINAIVTAMKSCKGYNNEK